MIHRLFLSGRLLARSGAQVHLALEELQLELASWIGFR